MPPLVDPPPRARTELASLAAGSETRASGLSFPWVALARLGLPCPTPERSRIQKNAAGFGTSQWILPAAPFCNNSTSQKGGGGKCGRETGLWGPNGRVLSNAPKLPEAPSPPLPQLAAQGEPSAVPLRGVARRSYSLARAGVPAEVERLKPAFRDGPGVSAEREQEPDAVGGGRRASRVQGGLSTGRQIHLGSAQQQVA